MLQWDDLRFFLAVEREGSLLGAARALNVDRATVIRRVSALEDRLRARLFDRTRDGCRLTAGGKKILGAAEMMEQTAASLVERINDEDTRLRGTVKITVTQGLAVRLIPELARWQREHPEVTIELVTTDRFLSLARREADIAIRNAKPAQPDLVAKRLGPVGFALYASREYLDRHGMPTGTWRGHRLIVYERPAPGHEWFAKHARDANVALRATDPFSVLEAARAGLGIALLPCLLAEPELSRIPPGIIASSEQWLVTQKTLLKTARVRVVWGLVADFFVRHAAILRGHG